MSAGRPRVRRHAEERPGGWQRVTQQEYGGIGRLASGSMERMKRLYVRENGVNRAVGCICDQDHVILRGFRTRRWPPFEPEVAGCGLPTTSRAMPFVDTNILVYAVSAAPEDEGKRRRSLELLARRDMVLSVQVLQEFYVQATRPSRTGALRHDEAVAVIESLQRFPVQAITLEVMRLALSFRQRFGLSYWDSAVLAGVGLSGCDLVYSEDLSSEQDYDGLQVSDPFANSSESQG